MTRFVTTMLLVIASASATGCGAPEDPTGVATSAEEQGNPNPGVVPAHSRVHGATYAEWGARWFQWDLAIPLAQQPPNDPTGVDCGIGQSGPVWFLAGAFGGTAARTCAIPAGKTLFFPLANYENDYPCPDPTFQPAPGQSLADFLTQGAEAVIDPVNALSASLDGVAFKDLFDYRATSHLFHFRADPSLVALDSCVTGTSQPAVSDGYWLMLKPLPAGAHTLSFGGASPYFSETVTWHLQIAAGEDD